MTEHDLNRAKELIRGEPDAEDCERFTSRYGKALLETAEANLALVEALGDLLGLIHSVCPEYDESTMCANARVALAKAEGRS